MSCEAIASKEVADIQNINLENFDEFSLKPPILTSPKSIEACRMLGIEPDELIARSTEYFLSHRNADEDDAFILKRADRYEKNRRALIKSAQSQRLELVEAEQNGVQGSMSLMTRNFCRSPLAINRMSFRSMPCSAIDDRSTFTSPIGNHNIKSSTPDYTVVEREKKELERMQLRQALELQKMITHELKSTEFHKEQLRKEKEIAKVEEEKARIMLKRKRKEMKKLKRKEMQLAEQRKVEMEIARKQMEENMFEKLAKEAQEKKAKDRKRKLAIQRQQELQKSKEAQRQQVEAMLQIQQQEIELREQEIERRETKRRLMLEHIKQMKARELAEKQRRNKLRITSVLEDKEYIRSLQLLENEKKQKLSEQRRIAFEEERRQKELEIRLCAQQKQLSIEAVQKQVQMQEKRRHEHLINQEMEVAKRLAEIENKKERRRQMKMILDKQMEIERKKVYKRMEQQLCEKQNAILEKAELKTAIAEAKIEENRHIMIERLHEAKLREEDIQSAIRRRQKQEAYRLEVLMSRLEADDERAKNIKEQRQALINRRKYVKLQAFRQKQQILNSFQQMKITKKYVLPNELLKRSLSVGKVQSGKLFSFEESDSNAFTDFVSKNEGTLQQKSLGKPLRKRPASAYPQTSRRREFDIFIAHNDKLYPNPNDEIDPANSKEGKYKQQLEIMHSTDEEEDQSDVQRVRLKEELLHVLIEEYHAEQQREILLQQAQENNNDQQEYTRMLQIFDEERAKASERILSLTKKQDQLDSQQFT